MTTTQYTSTDPKEQRDLMIRMSHTRRCKRCGTTNSGTVSTITGMQTWYKDKIIGVFCKSCYGKLRYINKKMRKRNDL